MKQITISGKYIFAIALIAFAIVHLINASTLTESNSPTGGVVWIYISGLIMLLAGVAVLIGKKDAIATLLLGFVLIINAVLIDMPNVIESSGTDVVATSHFLKDLALAGASFVYSRSAAKDRTERLT